MRLPDWFYPNEIVDLLDAYEEIIVDHYPLLQIASSYKIDQYLSQHIVSYTHDVQFFISLFS